MADIPKSRADLLTLFADNATGAISEQDLRDFVVSVLGEYGDMHTVTGVASLVTSATPTKLTSWTADGLSQGVTVDHTNDEITIITAGVYCVSVDACFSGTNSKTFMLAIYVNTGSGYVDAGAPRVKRKLGTGGDVGSSTVHDNVNLAADDKIAIFVWSTDGGTAFVLEEGTLSLKRVS